MNRLEQTFVALSATAAILAAETACSAPEQAANPQATISAAPNPTTPGCVTELTPGYTPGGPLPADTMQVTYLETKDTDHNISTVQKETGTIAVSAALSESLCVKVGESLFKVGLGIPADPEARNQVVIFTANSKNAGKVFANAGMPSLADTSVSTTSYSVTAGPSNEIQRTGKAVSVVGQETDGTGLFINIATERCQPLEMHTTPPLTLDDQETYATIKEAACNSLGAAIDRVHLHRTYEDYLRDYLNRAIGSDINQTNQTVLYPVVSRQQFEAMAQLLNK